MTKTRKSTAKAPRKSSASPDVADLARGANGLMEPVDPKDVAQGLVAAQMQAMSTMMTASAEMTAATFRAMSTMWDMSLPKSRGDRDEDR